MQLKVGIHDISHTLWTFLKYHGSSCRIHRDSTSSSPACLASEGHNWLCDRMCLAPMQEQLWRNIWRPHRCKKLHLNHSLCLNRDCDVRTPMVEMWWNGFERTMEQNSKRCAVASTLSWCWQERNIEETYHRLPADHWPFAALASHHIVSLHVLLPLYCTPCSGAMFQRLCVCGLSHHIKGLGEVHARCRMKHVRYTTWDLWDVSGGNSHLAHGWFRGSPIFGNLAMDCPWIIHFFIGIYMINHPFYWD